MTEIEEFKNADLRRLAQRLSQVHLLIIDRDIRIAEYVRDIFSAIGFKEIEVTDSAERAFAIMREKPIDVVITEWELNQMDGISLVKNLRGSSELKDTRLPIIMLTGNGERHHVTVARDAGITDFVIKPFNPKTLLDRMVQLAAAPREFVITPNFKGPCRRRRRSEKDAEGKNKRSATPPKPKMYLSEQDARMLESGEQSALILSPNNSLRTKLGHDVNLEHLLLPEVIQKVQRVLDSHRPGMMKALTDDFDALQTLHQNLNSDIASLMSYIPQLQRHVFTIKSQAGMIGYNLASEVARQLSNYLDQEKNFDAGFLVVLQKFIDALRSIFQLAIEGDGGSMGQELVGSLEKLVRKYRTH